MVQHVHIVKEQVHVELIIIRDGANRILTTYGAINVLYSGHRGPPAKQHSGPYCMLSHSDYKFQAPRLVNERRWCQRIASSCTLGTS